MSSTPCGQSEQDFEDPPQIQNLQVNEKKQIKCHRCHANFAQFHTTDYICKECLPDKILEKFRQSFRFETHDKILVAYSGGVNSRVLLDLLHRLRSPDPRQKRHFEMKAVFVDDTFLYQLISAQEHQDLLDLVKKTCQSINLELTILPLRHIFKCDISQDNNNDNEDKNDDDTKLDEQLNTLIQSLPNPSMKEDFVDFLRTRIIAQHALSIGVNKVVRGDTATKLATDVLSNTSKGRGFSIPADLQSIVNRFNVQWLNGMSSILNKESSLYARVCELEYIVQPIFSTLLTRPRGGINLLTQNFLANLQSKFNGTTFNILRTCEKLSTNLYTSQDHQNHTTLTPCCMCGKAIAPSVQGQEAAMLATSLSADERRDICYGCSKIIIHFQKNHTFHLIPPQLLSNQNKANKS